MVIALHLLLIPVAWFLQNILHEVSHLLAGWWFEGRRPKKLIPWPHKHKGKFYFARYECGPSTKDGYSMFRHVAPVYMATLWVLIASVLSIMTPLGTYCIPFVVAGTIDAGFFWWTYLWGSDKSDGKRFKSETR